MRRKARQSLHATRVLLERGLVDDAASRLYFALFQAAVHGLERQGKSPADLRPGATYWEHRTVCRHAALVLGKAEDEDLLADALVLRRDADYRTGPVERWRIESLRPEIFRFVEEVTS